MKTRITGALVVVLAGVVWGQPPAAPRNEKTPAALQAEIEALRPARVAWRQIAWRPCLLDGLKEARAQQKPMILWVFIDRPVDDQRC